MDDTRTMRSMDDTITAYNANQTGENKAICELLATQIHTGLPGATNKTWHGAPVWFLNGNPIVGYSVLKNDVQLLFWSGQSFDEPGLQPEGSFKAAQARYTSASQINTEDVKRWLTTSASVQWDYKNIVKRRGELERL